MGFAPGIEVAILQYFSVKLPPCSKNSHGRRAQ